MTSQSCLAQENSKANSKIKVIYIYNFTRYIKWPKEDTLKEFSIGILGDNEVLKNELEFLSTHKSFHNLPIKVKAFHTVDDISPTQMLYVSGDDGFDQDKIFHKIKGKGTLLVAENLENFKMSMINFIKKNDKQKFSLNKKVVEAENFKVDSILISMAILDETGWKDVYSQFNELLKSNKTIVEINKKDLQKVVLTHETQKKEIANQKESIDKQTLQIKEQNEIVENQKQQMNKAICDINQKNQEIFVKQQKIKLQEEKLISLSKNNGMLSKNIEKKMEMLSMQKVDIKNQKLQMEAQLIILSQQKKEMQTQQTNIFNQKNILKTQLSQIETQRLMLYMFIGVIVLCLSLVFFIYRSYSLKKKANIIITQQKSEVEKAKDIADSQRIIAVELREIAENQKHIVEEKQKEIVDSITYARRIQRALLTSDEYIKNNLVSEHFILFKPKDIVSGDFYWALSIAPLPGWDMGTNKVKLNPDTKRGNTFYIATADCTGHGVPGAFMSMLNISYLNENVIERGVRMPHDIFNVQRTEIIKALNPPGSIEECKDGMDCILCVYDFDKMLLHFAAANNPLWLVRSGELIEYKADKMPVGKYSEEMRSFSLQTIELQKGDIIYTSTDGFADQFGTNGKKLMKKKLKEELLTIHHQPMDKQKEYLNQFFENWKGNSEQIDDVCIIGIRV